MFCIGKRAKFQNVIVRKTLWHCGTAPKPAPLLGIFATNAVVAFCGTCARNAPRIHGNPRHYWGSSCHNPATRDFVAPVANRACADSANVVLGRYWPWSIVVARGLILNYCKQSAALPSGTPRRHGPLATTARTQYGANLGLYGTRRNGSASHACHCAAIAAAIPGKVLDRARARSFAGSFDVA